MKFLQTRSCSILLLIALNTVAMTHAHDLLREGAKLAAVIDEDDRRTEEEFSRERSMPLTDVQRRYAATGTLTCPKMDISANLALSTDILVTSAHAFIDPDTCVQHTQVNQCKFVLKGTNTASEFDVDRLEGTGYTCPPSLPDPRRDWAVVRLKKHVEGVAPFSVDASDPSLQITAGQQLALVSAQSFDFWKNRAGHRHWPKSIGVCRSKKIYYLRGTEAYFSMNCDTGLGSSGGAILLDAGPSPVLIGIVRGNNESESQVQAAIKRRMPNVGIYQESVWASYGVALRGEFLRTLLKAAYGDEKDN